MVQMAQIPVKKVYLNAQSQQQIGIYEFDIDCGAVYFEALYDKDGTLKTVDQYFYAERSLPDSLERVTGDDALLAVDTKDYASKTYMLTKFDGKNEWLRFHAVVPREINPEYFRNKYIGN